MTVNSASLTIAFVTTEYVTEKNFDGGLSNYLHRVAMSLKQLGHHPIIFVITDRNEKLIHKGIEVNRLRVSGWKLMRLINLITLRQFSAITYLLWLSFYINFVIKRLNRSYDFSIIQYPSCAGIGLFCVKEIPSIIRISGYLPLWNKAYEAKRTISLVGNEKIEDIAYTKADALFAPSQLNAKAVEEAVGRPVKVIETPFILDTTELNDSLYQTHLKDKKYLLFFGTIGLMKGCGLIAEIIYDLLHNNADLYFVFVGKDKGYLGFEGKSILDQIKENAAEYQGKVIHFDRLTHDYLYPIIAHAYGVVLPSRVDNFPNTCLESMAHKRVVIGTQGTSFEQLIIDGVSGFLCEKDNAQDLLQTINKVLQLNPEDKVRIEEKASQRIEELRPEKVVNQLVDFYCQVINDFQKKT